MAADGAADGEADGEADRSSVSSVCSSVSMFQSPCGEVVMKANDLYGNNKVWLVSVPLRGSGDERRDTPDAGRYRNQFQSPCGEVVMKVSITLCLLPNL